MFIVVLLLRDYGACKLCLIEESHFIGTFLIDENALNSHDCGFVEYTLIDLYIQTS